MADPSPIRAGEVRRICPSSILASSVVTVSSTPSTMDEARSLLDRREPPFVVVAHRQTAGRGRGVRTWQSSPGDDLTFTAALGFGPLGPSLPPFTLALGVALHRAVTDILGHRGAQDAGLTLKWPNDLMAGGRKLAGVLSEAVLPAGGDGSSVVLAGVGLNVNTTRFEVGIAHVATSLGMLTGLEHDREQVLAVVLAAIEDVAREFASGGFAAFGAEYGSRCLLWGQVVDVEGLHGTMYGVDGTGALVLRHEDGTTSVVSSGHVTLISPR